MPDKHARARSVRRRHEEGERGGGRGRRRRGGGGGQEVDDKIDARGESEGNVESEVVVEVESERDRGEGVEGESGGDEGEEGGEEGEGGTVGKGKGERFEGEEVEFVRDCEREREGLLRDMR